MFKQNLWVSQSLFFSRFETDFKSYHLKFIMFMHFLKSIILNQSCKRYLLCFGEKSYCLKTTNRFSLKSAGAHNQKPTFFLLNLFCLNVYTGIEFIHPIVLETIYTFVFFFFTRQAYVFIWTFRFFLLCFCKTLKETGANVITNVSFK